jgi:hypothetical protein
MGAPLAALGKQTPSRSAAMNDEDKRQEDKPSAKEARRIGAESAAVERAPTHDAGVARGAMAGAAAGAVAGGMAAGPVGSLIGAAAGAVAGAALGSAGPPKEIDLGPHIQWWREHFVGRGDGLPAGFEVYEPAYRYGTEQYLRSERPRDWDEVEEELQLGWVQSRGESTLSWDEARPAVRDAWERLHDPEGFEKR